MVALPAQERRSVDTFFAVAPVAERRLVTVNGAFDNGLEALAGWLSPVVAASRARKGQPRGLGWGLVVFVVVDGRHAAV
jgi:hypothetical protein